VTPQEYGLEKVAYSIRETGKLLSIGRTAVYDLIRSGDLSPVKPCKKNLILAVEVAALLDKWRDPTHGHERNVAAREASRLLALAKDRKVSEKNASILAAVGL
jgi:hypothetical protein